MQDVTALSNLVNSAYRGESSKKGWTTEADLLGGQRTDPDTLRATIADPNAVILLTFQENDLVACVFLQNRKTTGYLGMLTVSPHLQAGGIGRQLLQMSEEWVAQNWRLTKMEMQVIEQRTELVSWYGRRGYVVTNRRAPFPYGDPKFGEPKVQGLQFIILEKALAAPTHRE